MANQENKHPGAPADDLSVRVQALGFALDHSRSHGIRKDAAETVESAKTFEAYLSGAAAPAAKKSA